MSATPLTRGLGKYFDKLIVGSTTKELIDKGYLPSSGCLLLRRRISPLSGQLPAITATMISAK
jgi:hypothetical protein